jgi:hypothetical protein
LRECSDLVLPADSIDQFDRSHAEEEADLFGLNAAREPHGFASVAMRLSTYRKLEPSPLEEMFFFNHPSGRSRVTMAMRWFQETSGRGCSWHERAAAMRS